MIEEKRSGYMSGLLTEGTKLAAQQAMHSQYVLQLLQLQRRAGFLCDITINIEEKSFKAHKPLLAACSLYFRALFADCGNAKTSALNLQLSANGFEVLLDYIYSGSLAITSENSDQVLHAANCLQMTNVVETCLNFVRSSFKATSGESIKPGRPDGLDLPLALHGSETSKNSHALTQAQIQTNMMHLTIPSAKIPSQNLPVQPASAQPEKSTDGSNNSIEALNKSAADISEQDLVTEATPIVSPTSETLTMIMPYLVAKNARRPTLNEVRQLLSTRNSISATHAETITTDSLKSIPPQLIPAGHPDREHESDAENKQHPRNHNRVTQEENHILRCSSLEGVQAHPSGDSNIASRATVDAGHATRIGRTSMASKDVQPFVMIPHSGNARPRKSDDFGKSSAWSDDRSVKNDQTKDQTHLSSTPCPANLTINTSSINTMASPRRLYPAASPESFGSTPSIEISPISEATSDSPNGEVNFPLKLRWARAQSLDFSKTMTTNTTESSPRKAVEDFRSSSLSPRFFGSDSPNLNGERPPLISAEEAASAAGALLIKGPIKKRNHSGSFETEARVGYKLHVKSNSDEINDCEEELNSPASEKVNANADLPKENDISQSPAPGRLLIKQEVDYTPSTSPPTEESYFLMDQEDAASRSTTPSVATTTSHEGVVDENGVLDLSVQKNSNRIETSQIRAMLPQPTSGHSMEGNAEDLKTREAFDTLVMMQTPYSTTTADAKSLINPSAEDGPLTAGFSRKPRRSSGGQTCHWPGCGRLFRHRNIFEEHLKLHEIGVPVKQLRRCYMGARVKKTARERLDEMRSVEGGATNVVHSVSDSQEINAPAFQRASHKRKRAPSSQTKEGSDRKRVTAKDRKDHLARSGPWQQHQTQASIQHTPLYRPSGLPLPVMHNARSDGVHRQQAAWPLLGVQASHLVNGGQHLNLLNFSNAAAPGIPSVLGQAGNGIVATNAGNNHSTTVVQALTALGISIPPNNRDASLLESPSPQRPSIPGVALTSPNSGVALDHLRRSIAMRESLESSLVTSSEQRIGNVPRSKYSTNDKPVTTSIPVISNHSTRPGPNPYHSSSVVQRVAKI